MVYGHPSDNENPNKIRTYLPINWLMTIPEFGKLAHVLTVAHVMMIIHL